MIASDEATPKLGSNVVLHHRCPPKLASPDDERLIEQSTLIEVRQQTIECPVDLTTLDRQRLIETLPGR